MDDLDALYSIALASLARFKGLWDRLLWLSKERTKITGLFIDDAGQVMQST